MNHQQNADDPSIDLVLHTSLGVVVFALWAMAVWVVL